VVLVDGTEEEGSDAVSTAEFKEFAGVREFADGVLDLAEAAVKPVFELREGDVGGVAVVEVGDREAEFGAELFEGHFGALGLCENEIGRFENGWEVVYESA
jgi:hypothetical protein